MYKNEQCCSKDDIIDEKKYNYCKKRVNLFLLIIISLGFLVALILICFLCYKYLKNKKEIQEEVEKIESIKSELDQNRTNSFI